MKRIGLVAAVLAAIALAAASGPALAVDEPALVVQTAYSKLGAPYRLGSKGPDKFDCSGFVWWAFTTAGFGDRVGTVRMVSREYQKWFRARGRLYVDPAKVEVGDLAFWGDPAKHIGIVTRIATANRKPRLRIFVTSALDGWGVLEQRVDLIGGTKPFSGYAAVDLTNVPDPTPTPSPTPSLSPSPEPTDPTPVPTDSPSPEPSPTGLEL
jgi:hypothetical protein